MQNRACLVNKVDTYLVEVVVKRLAQEAAYLNDKMNSIETDLTIILNDFTARTGKNITAIEVRKIEDKYKILLEISR